MLFLYTPFLHQDSVDPPRGQSLDSERANAPFDATAPEWGEPADTGLEFGEAGMLHDLYEPEHAPGSHIGSAHQRSSEVRR
jgi:hypothetical protein